MKGFATCRAAVRRELGLLARRRPRRRLSLALSWLLLAGTAGAGELSYQQATPPPGLAEFDAGDNSAPELADLDGDGDLDAVVGSRLGHVAYLENTGGAATPGWAARTGSANPLAEVFPGHFTTPELADLDGDGDLDLLVGEQDGGFSYYRNTGSVAAPAFLFVFEENPLLELEAGVHTSLELADLDGDGDLDALAGREEEGLAYFENTGSAGAAAFVARSGSADPFDGFVTGGRAMPRLVDVDGDHDLDLLIGGSQLFFENSGGTSAPAFVERSGRANPFAAIELGAFESPALGDLDGDGDLDALFGEGGGLLYFFRAWRPAVFRDGFESGGTLAWSASSPLH